MKIRKQLVASREKTWSGTNLCLSITVHETANTSRGANAAAHANLQSRGNVRDASWHYQVDDKEIVQSFPDDVMCWHAGYGARHSIAIEICVNADGDYDKAVQNAEWLVRRLRKEHGLERDDVVQHNFWTGKNCPTKLRAAGRWGAFLEATDPKPTEPARLAVDGWWGPATTRRLQEVLGTPVDGVISGQYRGSWNRHIPSVAYGGGGSLVVKAMQRRLGVTVDGYLGPLTIKALQRHYGTPVDGIISGPSLVVQAMQKSLNKGRF